MTAATASSSHLNPSSKGGGSVSGSGDEDKGEKIVADRYLKKEILGEGTYGVVFKALDTKVPTFNDHPIFSIFYFLFFVYPIQFHSIEFEANLFLCPFPFLSFLPN